MHNVSYMYFVELIKVFYKDLNNARYNICLSYRISKIATFDDI